ncbi:Ig-like domain (group 2), partial [Lachnospiraceae bacterium]
SEEYGSYADVVGGKAGSYTVKAVVAGTDNYEAAESVCDFTIEPLMVVLKWSDTKVIYDKKSHVPTADIVNIVGEDSVSAKVDVEGEAVNAGEYFATAVSLQGADAANYKLPETVIQTFYIDKSDKVLEKEPKAKKLIYNGKAQALVEAGIAGNDAMEYALGKDIAPKTGWEKDSSKITGENVGEYRVWYRVEGDENYYATQPDYVDVTILQASNSATISLDNWTYGTTPAEPEIRADFGAEAEDTVTEYKAKTAEDSEYQKEVPIDAGDYTVRVTIEETENYKGTVATADFSIEKAHVTVTADAKTKAYGDADPELTYTAGDMLEGNEITGALTREEGEDAGNYAIGKGTLDAGNNYVIDYISAYLTIEQATENRVTVSIENWYKGDEPSKPQAKATFGADTAVFMYCGAEEYSATKSADEAVFSEEIPEKAGSYYVKAVISETGNYVGAVSEPVSFEILDREVEAIEKAVEELPDNVQIKDEEAVKAARKAYDSLTVEQKALVPEDTVKKLEKAEADLKTAKEEATKKAAEEEAARNAAEKKAADDAVAAKKVTDLVNALPANVEVKDAGAVKTARTAYDSLTVEQKALVPEDTVKKLEKAEADLKTAKEEAAKKAAEEEAARNAAEKKAADDAVAAKKVTDLVNALPANVEVKDAGAVKTARTAYDALTADQKNKVSAETLKKLVAAEAALAAAETKDMAAKQLEIDKREAQAAMNEQVTVTQKGSKIAVKWKRSTSADGYDVYVSYCGKKATKPAKTIKKNTITKITITKIDGKKILTNKIFRVYVMPYKIINGKKVVLAKSIVAHIVGVTNPKYCNVKKLTIKKNRFTVRVGKTAKIKASVTLAKKNKKHIDKSHGAKLRYKSSNTGIATVSKNGTIKGVSKGTCVIYVYSINGLMKKVRVTVK